MKTKSLITILFPLCFFYYTVHSQTYRIAVKQKGSGTCSYINLKGEVIAETRNSFCYDYSEEGAAITLNVVTDCILIDSIGNTIIPETKLKVYMAKWENTYNIDYNLEWQFTDVNQVRESHPKYNLRCAHKSGIFRVKKKGKIGGVNTSGKISVQFVYDELTNFDKGYALGRIDKTYFIVRKNGKTSIIDDYGTTYFKQFMEGYAPIEVEGKKWGFIDTLGNLKITPQYESVGHFHGNHAWARTENSTIGFINKKGEWVIEPQFSVVDNFDKESGIALVQYFNDNIWQYIDSTGKFWYYDLPVERYHFSNGLAIAKSNNKVGYINNKGVWIIEPVFKKGNDFYNGFASVKKDGAWGLINKKGEWVLQPKYKYVGRVVLLN